MLRAVAGQVDAGFGGDEIGQVIQRIDKLTPGEVVSSRFTVQHDGKPAELEIQIFLDRPKRPELFFFAPKRLHRAIASCGDDLQHLLRQRRRERKALEGPGE